MVDALPGSARAELGDPFAQLTGPLASTTRLDFEVVDSRFHKARALGFRMPP